MYDFYNRRPLEAVVVYSSSGRAVITDSVGKYSIPVRRADSIWFSYLGKNTHKYPIDTISNLNDFEVALHIDAVWLPTVKVHNQNYLQDSEQNRKDYAKVFNYHKPGLAITQNDPANYVPGSVTVGIDLDQLIESFQFRKNREELAFQRRLVDEEHDKYVAHRFSKRFVGELTKLKSPELDDFMNRYKPPYELVLQLNDLELGYYIERCFTLWERRR